MLTLLRLSSIGLVMVVSDGVSSVGEIGFGVWLVMGIMGEVQQIWGWCWRGASRWLVRHRVISVVQDEALREAPVQ